MNILVNKTIDAKGLACPMPIVKTKKAMGEIAQGQVLEIQATDKGSVADIQGWAKNTGHQYLGTLQENDVYRHFIRKADPHELKEEEKYPHTVTNQELQTKLENRENPVILDVREPAEYAFGHIPGAVSIPLGELEERSNELNPQDEIYVICRTGNRSDMACHLLKEKGFTKLKNILPGMTQWSGPVEKVQ